MFPGAAARRLIPTFLCLSHLFFCSGVFPSRSPLFCPSSLHSPSLSSFFLGGGWLGDWEGSSKLAHRWIMHLKHERAGSWGWMYLSVTFPPVLLSCRDKAGTSEEETMSLFSLFWLTLICCSFSGHRALRVSCSFWFWIFMADFVFFPYTAQAHIHWICAIWLNSVRSVCLHIRAFPVTPKADCTHEHELSSTIIKEMRRKLVLNLTTNRERASKERKGGRKRERDLQSLKNKS